MSTHRLIISVGLSSEELRERTAANATRIPFLWLHKQTTGIFYVKITVINSKNTTVKAATMII